MNALEHIDALVLCGGKGTRIQSVLSSTPKCLAPFGTRTYIDLFLDYLHSYGYRRFILCTGVGRDLVRAHFEKHRPKHLTIDFSEETTPLGTGGALVHALPKIQSTTVGAFNGDVFCSMDHQKFYEFHASQKSTFSIALSSVKECGDFGRVILKGDSIMAFEEKRPGLGQGWVNNGAYLFSRKILESLPQKFPLSLELDVFPKLAQSGALWGFKSPAELMDIGTPERYDSALKIMTQRS